MKYSCQTLNCKNKLSNKNKFTKQNSWDTFPSGGKRAPKPNAENILSLFINKYARFSSSNIHLNKR